jgi:hypothetical protein
MRYNLIFTPIFLISLATSSCKKENNAAADCFPGATTVRVITNKKAMIKVTGSQIYIVEENTIDTKLNPCALDPKFKIDNLLVNISGQVKATPQVGPGPCCIENFVITSISR